ncbi:hypothetical protein PP568_12515 [Mycobacteroides abscessus]|uniref:Uncharacterized protein n=1 Tax=Mycobacteroides abscessus subsp. abscessus TaxID=1185650 RepID=A0AB38CVQ4_9MYCO|nr:hypothetical protein [Mycobacteroides abscessus]MBE5421098.1 hypothetical protein [Mycobacteroides abscessus]MBE5454226.1 hypothetical protein [Mycobacteroides abscessus]MBN7299171.1 hypothetical protein [Mycobacteroides abscessus subsp. abscessus]MBN7378379.1 hypothetical protein [Mycobacteroides abscessus subsp. massiliense]MBN7383632.1 hypothetical protein [Mycobacteroides abscessus subsp. massiliense]
MHEDTPFEELPEYWRRVIRKLRREGIQLRIERNECRRQLSELTDRLLAGE